MDHLQLDCPRCAATLKLPAPLPAGKAVKCSGCGHVFVPVPNGQAAAVPAGPESDHERRKRLRRHMWEFFYRDTPEGVGDNDSVLNLLFIYADADHGRIHDPSFARGVRAQRLVWATRHAEGEAGAYLQEQNALLQALEEELTRLPKKPPPQRSADWSFLDRLHSIPWKTSRHARGPAGDTPVLLRQFVGRDEKLRNWAWDALCASLYQDGKVFGASVAAAPVFIRMLATPGCPEKPRILALLKAFYQADGYNVLRGSTAAPGTVAEFDLKIGDEPDWGAAMRARIREELPVLLRGLKDDNWRARLHTPAFLIVIKEDLETVKRALDAALQEETHPLCRAQVLDMLGAAGEPILPRWHAGIKNDPSTLLRFVAAMRIAMQQKQQCPRDVVQTLLAALDDPLLRNLYERLPSSGRLIADAGAAMTWVAPQYVLPALNRLVADLDTQTGEVDLNFTRTLLNLTCHLVQANVFREPQRLTPDQWRAVAALGRQLERAPKHEGLKRLYDSYWLPNTVDAFQAYLAQADKAE